MKLVEIVGMIFSTLILIPLRYIYIFNIFFHIHMNLYLISVYGIFHYTNEINEKCFNLENAALSWSNELSDGVEDGFGKNLFSNPFAMFFKSWCFKNFF